MFSKILIANRGEIAVRIAQTCRELGVLTVGVYSETDRTAQHVLAADVSVPIGGISPRVSYLNAIGMIRAAIDSGAEAIHPGYGFLAENAEFAEAVVSAGLVWIGPPSAAIALLGDKVRAKRVAAEAGVPVIPGYSGPDLSPERLRHEAARVGYPLMLKAAAGGGGKGMRIVERASELEESLDAARREANAAFGDERVFLEHLLRRPRHVEIQILGDHFGEVVYLGERDCSLQRRHQKVVEEAPSSAVSPELRAAMGEAAVRIARATGYVNAGTVEFLLSDGEVYFLEVNTRIQVEHPITEEITGLDLVRLQLEVAAGQPLPFSQQDIALRGHAIEVRIYAEDPNRGFLPATGRLVSFEPPEGAGIRNDVGVRSGDTITMHYDPMIAKLVVHAETRNLAVARLQRALDRYVCNGPTNNLSFARWIANHSDFCNGDVDVEWIDRKWRPAQSGPPPLHVLMAVALYDAGRISRGGNVWADAGSWRMTGIPRRMRYVCEEDVYETALIARGVQLWHVTTGDTGTDVEVLEMRSDRIVYRVGDAVTAIPVHPIADGYVVTDGDASYTFTRSIPRFSGAVRGSGIIEATDHTAPMPGTIVKVAVAVGDRVAAGEPLVILEAMKMEHVVEATTDGTVCAVLVSPGDMVAASQLLVRLEP